jgi:hypothetical protein
VPQVPWHEVQAAHSDQFPSTAALQVANAVQAAVSANSPSHILPPLLGYGLSHVRLRVLVAIRAPHKPRHSLQADQSEKPPSIGSSSALANGNGITARHWLKGPIYTP